MCKVMDGRWGCCSAVFMCSSTLVFAGWEGGIHSSAQLQLDTDRLRSLEAVL